MSRPSPFGHPCLLGFDEVEQALSRLPKNAGEGYPPYNVERVARAGSEPERLRIVLAVAGFTPDQLEITLEDGRLVVTGCSGDDSSREFLHRGIASRQFQRTFVLADGLEVLGAEVARGLLRIELARPEPTRVGRRIAIVSRD